MAPALHALGLLLAVLLVLPANAIRARVRHAAGPSYRGIHASCPQTCIASGSNPAHWPLYPSVDHLQICSKAMFLEFSLHDNIEDTSVDHRVHACSIHGSDWSVVRPVSLPPSSHSVWAQPVKATYETGWDWNPSTDNYGLSLVDAQALVGHMRGFLSNNHAPLNEAVHLFGKVGDTTLGLYLGPAVQTNSTAVPALEAFEATLEELMEQTNGASRDSMAMQLCDAAQDGSRVLGIMVAKYGRLPDMQKVLRTWDSGGCLPFVASRRLSVAGSAVYMDPSHMETELLRRQRMASPEPNANGTCATYTIKAGDSCESIAAVHKLTSEQIESFNNKTWAWAGCANPTFGTVICVSNGAPPMPASITNAVCGPQKPGTLPPAPGTDLAELNPCPLNACCDAWGRCGTTPDMCMVRQNSAPSLERTNRLGTGGCISNCQHTFLPGLQAPSKFRTVGYFEGDNLERSCQHQDALQINTTEYSHVHFAYATLRPDFSLLFKSKMAVYQFENFKKLQGTNRILSIGGRAFSTGPQTHEIFRRGVTTSYRHTLAAKISEFVYKHGLDGVDLVWEYPGATDIPLIPAGSPDEGPNYLAFLQVLREMMPSKSISVAAPATYWYLKGFPISNISDVVDYIVYQTTDLHGQWDANNRYAQPDCPTGTCLRSAVNITETMNALGMITRAGVPSNKVVVSYASYGRSFKMADASCWTENCRFTGKAGRSEAKLGTCSGVAGFLSNAEIKEIQATPERVQHDAYDPLSGSNILVYDKDNWVSWMDAGTRRVRAQMYESLNLGGTALWAINLEDMHDLSAVAGAKSWSEYKYLVNTGQDPWKKPAHRRRGVNRRPINAQTEYAVVPRTGNWTRISCNDSAVKDIAHLTAQERWSQLDGPGAWADISNVWTFSDNMTGHITFLESLAYTINAPLLSKCDDAAFAGCQDTTLCVDSFVQYNVSGAVGFEVWNSVVELHRIFVSLYSSLLAAQSSFASEAQDFENNLAPVPPPAETPQWLQLLLAALSFGFAMVVGPFFDSVLAGLSFFVANKALFEVSKSLTTNALAYGLPLFQMLADDNKQPWSTSDQASFTALMNEVFNSWCDAIRSLLASLWDGSVDSLASLGSLISDGQLIAGSMGSSEASYPLMDPPNGGLNSTVNLARKSVFAFAAPMLWAASDKTVFIMDSGMPCSGPSDDLQMYMTYDDQNRTYYCDEDDNRAYFLAMHNDSKKTRKMRTRDEQTSGLDNVYRKRSKALFEKPIGIEALTGVAYGGLTWEDLIRSALQTYKANGNENDGDASNMDDQTIVENAITYGINSPGFITIPVCSGDMASRALRVLGATSSLPNFPCVVAPVDNLCDASTFSSNLSDDSPLISDCLDIIANIQGTKGTYRVYYGKERAILTSGTCTFVVQVLGKPDDVKIGNQDAIDIIAESINRFNASGMVGAAGVLVCGNNEVGWNISHSERAVERT